MPYQIANRVSSSRNGASRIRVARFTPSRIRLLKRLPQPRNELLVRLTLLIFVVEDRLDHANRFLRRQRDEPVQRDLPVARGMGTQRLFQQWQGERGAEL